MNESLKLISHKEITVKPPRIETERLILTWPTPSQIEDYYLAIKGTNMFDTLEWDGPSEPEDLHEFWQANTQNDPEKHEFDLQVALIDKEEHRYIGGAGLRPVEGDPAHIDIGYALAPEFHGKGFATEAIGALVDEAFKNRGAQRIFAGVHLGNDASRSVVEKVGFALEGVRRRLKQKRGVWLDDWLLAITLPDWERRSV